MKFPDLYITKFFFKKKLYESSGNVLELGCGNGNNLSLFYSYGYNVCGIDIDKKSIDDALFNLENVFKNEFENTFEFINGDIRKLDKILKTNSKFNILLLPNIINYISKNDFLYLLQEVKNYLTNKGKFFIRFRTPRDMRVGLSKKIHENEYIIESEITGEKNAYLTVYEESQMIFLLKEFFKIDNYEIFHLYEENFHMDRKILNADVVIWGDFSL